MKKIMIAATLLPAASFAHESHTLSSFMHAVEHHLANPLFAIALVVGLAGLSFSLFKAFKR